MNHDGQVERITVRRSAFGDPALTCGKGAGPSRSAGPGKPTCSAFGILSCLVVVGTTWILAGAASAQLSSDDIASLQARAKVEGWTFTVGENPATTRSLRQLCGLVVPEDWWANERFDPCTPRRDLPVSFDWRDLNGCTSVKDQGNCGSCWAFATVGALECAVKIKDSLETDLSEQWLVSCNRNGWGCDGGYVAHEYHMWKTDPCDGTGAVLETEFPYVAAEAPCSCPYPHEYLIESWAYIGTGTGMPSVEAVKQAILDYGPVSVGVYADSAFQAYTGGVFNACQNNSGINHAVVLVGWDDSQGTAGVWFLRNSWGPAWGEGGYMRIEYGCSQVGYGASYVDYPGYDPFEVLPHSGLLVTGDPGGPFTPTCKSYTLTNDGADPLSWAATKTVDWVDVVPSNGILAASTPATVDVCINSNVNALPADVYAGMVTFTNLDSSFTRAREAALWIGPLFDVPIDPTQSTVTVELCYAGTCGSDTSDITGTLTTQLNDIDNPTTISLFDFELEFIDDLHLVLSWGILGAFDSTIAGLIVQHAEPGLPVGPTPIAADAFVFRDPPQELEGTLTYTSWGVPCWALQDAGLPCSDTHDLTGARPDSSEFRGTITTDNRTVSLVSQIEEEMLFAGLATLQSSGTIRGQVFVPEPTPGDVNRDGDVDLTDFANWPGCVTGPDIAPYGAGCGGFDFNGDMDVDLGDFAGFQAVFTGPNP